jgi:hypothetical protein
MNQHRGPLLLILCAVIFVSGGYASPIHKSAINRDLGFHSTYAVHGSTSTDNWLGGTGNWSDSWCWGSGLPSGGSDVVVYSGGFDLVYLDTSASIASLTLGGDDGGGSQLVDNGTPQTLTVAGALTVNLTGALYLAGGNRVTVGADSTNAGVIQLENGSALQVNGNLNNSQYIALTGSQGQFGTLVNTGGIDIYEGTLTVAGDIQNAGLYGAGIVVDDAQIRVGGSLINSAMFTANGKVLVIGDLVNTGFGMMFLHGQMTVTGSTNNSAWVEIGMDEPSQVTFGSLVNSGQIYTVHPSGFSVVGNATNTGTIMDYDFDYAGRGFSVGGNLNNSGTIYTGFDVRGSLTNSGNISIGSAEIGGNLINSGAFGVLNMYYTGNGRLTVHGNVDNSGGLYLEQGSTTNIGGRLTNTASGYLVMSSDISNQSNVLNVGSVVNQGR